MNPELARQKYLTYPLPKLVKLADKHFNAFIRTRDKDKGCVSCSSKKVEHASHFYSAGNYKALRYHEDNVHGSCAKCNTWLRGNLLEYRQSLKLRLGPARLEALENIAAYYKRTGYKVDRMALIDIILKY